jgi:hypothetical protein
MLWSNRANASDFGSGETQQAAPVPRRKNSLQVNHAQSIFTASDKRLHGFCGLPFHKKQCVERLSIFVRAAQIITQASQDEPDAPQ